MLPFYICWKRTTGSRREASTLYSMVLIGIWSVLLSHTCSDYHFNGWSCFLYMSSFKRTHTSYSTFIPVLVLAEHSKLADPVAFFRQILFYNAFPSRIFNSEVWRVCVAASGSGGLKGRISAHQQAQAATLVGSVSLISTNVSLMRIYFTSHINPTNLVHSIRRVYWLYYTVC